MSVAGLRLARRIAAARSIPWNGRQNMREVGRSALPVPSLVATDGGGARPPLGMLELSWSQEGACGAAKSAAPAPTSPV
jgi:hypothetical protein